MLVNDYFGNCDEKYLDKFYEKTPEGNFIEGVICKKPNRYLGSLLITGLNGEPHEQFIQSMPKIHYFNNETDISPEYKINAYEKLDGTCLIIYPILENGKIVELVPKTRGRAVADKHFLKLYNLCDKSAIYNYYRSHKGILFFELCGILNQHEILHYDVGIDLALIGCFYDDTFLTVSSLNFMSSIYNFRMPDLIASIYYDYGDWVINFPSKKYNYFFNEIPNTELVQPTIEKALDKLEFILEYLNNKYVSFYNRLATEGVVINCINQAGNQKYIKLKPKSFQEKILAETGIPRNVIAKEVRKYFDEYGSQIREFFNQDPKHHTEYLNRMLCEEFSEEMVKKSSKKIEKVFMQIWDSKQVPVSIHNICEELKNEYGDKGITYCMRMFAERYPMKKNQANTVYNILRLKGVE